MSRPSPRTAIGLAILALLAAVAAVLVLRGRGPEAPPPEQPPPANRIVPDGFVARLSTEALGHAPDQRAWEAATSYFQEHGCTTATVQEYARRIYTGDEYAGLDLGAPERAITLYAGTARARARQARGRPRRVGARGRRRMEGRRRTRS